MLSILLFYVIEVFFLFYKRVVVCVFDRYLEWFLVWLILLGKVNFLFDLDLGIFYYIVVMIIFLLGFKVIVLLIYLNFLNRYIIWLDLGEE